MKTNYGERFVIVGTGIKTVKKFFFQNNKSIRRSEWISCPVLYLVKSTAKRRHVTYREEKSLRSDNPVLTKKMTSSLFLLIKQLTSVGMTEEWFHLSSYPTFWDIFSTRTKNCLRSKKKSN
jgi:hypothetical protein